MRQRVRLLGHEPLNASQSVIHTQKPRENEKRRRLPSPRPGAVCSARAVGIVDQPSVIQFYALGDTGGIAHALPQKDVAAAMISMHKAVPVDFMYHLGDWVYYNGEARDWYQQFYEPYDGLAVPIVGIPGNHDGDNLTPGPRSLDAWMRNVCSPRPMLTPEAGDSNRDAMTQPYCYWSLKLNLCTIIGLYTNTVEGGYVDKTQRAWLEDELRLAPKSTPVIVALHHPPISADTHHGGSLAMMTMLDIASLNANRWPTLVLSGHVHNYQRFTRQVAPQVIGGPGVVTYVVAGAGGYHNLHPISPDVTSLPWQASSLIELESYNQNHWGFLRLTVRSDGTIYGGYYPIDETGASLPPADSFLLKGI